MAYLTKKILQLKWKMAFCTIYNVGQPRLKKCPMIKGQFIELWKIFMVSKWQTNKYCKIVKERFVCH